MTRRSIYLLILLLVAALPAVAQNPTGTLAGRVTDSSGPLPGVTIQLTSTALQGSRTAVSTANGDYIFRFLPPGDYTVVFTLDGFKEQTAEVKISAAQARTLDAILYPESFAEEILVTGSFETISTGNQASSTFEQDLIDKLALPRTNVEAAFLTAGVSNTGPAATNSAEPTQAVIAGAHAYDTLFLVNGVVINENLRAESLPLFIEDAIQETTATVSGISAEYGRFQGGVINTITKSGGNDFSGSFRINLQNDKWIGSNQESPDRVDDINQIYEATVGGFVLKDRIWFFLAGRDKEISASDQTRYTFLPFNRTDQEKRYEGKLTWSIVPNHRLIGSYIEIQRDRTNTFFGSVLDYASLNPNRSDPQDIWSVNYTGVFTESFFGEAQYSQRYYGIAQGSGSPTTEILGGTLLLDLSRGSARYHTPTFCSAPECLEEERSNEDTILKGSYFASSDEWGSHDIVFGFDRFNDIRAQDNHQQGSDFRIYGSGAVIRDGEIYPVFNNRAGLPSIPSNRRTFYRWTPIFAAPQGTDFITDSIFVNDTWRYSENWSFNLGLRYDKNDGTDSSNNTVADDSRVSPRLGATWDPTGNGDLLFNLGFAYYVTGITQGIANNAGAGGEPAWTKLWYEGPCVNCEAWDPTTNSADNDYSGPLLSQDEAIQVWYDWFLANGGVSELPGFTGGSFPGFTPVIRTSLKSPYTEEWTMGVTKRLGTRGIVRADIVHREGNDFYVETTTPGDVADTGFVGDVDVSVITNDSSVYSRKYDGLHTSVQYRFGDRVSVGGTWAWSHARGNLDGETWNSGPVTGLLTQYPEYREARWNEPYGDLNVDQRHKVRGWVVWDAISTSRHSLSVSLMQNFASGTGYSAIGEVDPTPYITNPGYLTPPEAVNYYFGGRNTYKWDDVTSTDLALNYSFTVPAFGADLELFLQPEIQNLFNESAQINGNVDVNQLADFNPFTDTPVEGVHWEPADSFGDPRSERDFQTPRTFRVSLGIRF